MHIEANTFMPMEIPAMTDLHEEERIMLNGLYGLLSQETLDTALIDTKLDALLAHTTGHFELENRNMRLIEFRPYPVHKEEHDTALAKMQAAFEHWKNNRDLAALRQYLEKELPDWLQFHIASMDMITARFMQMHQDKGGELELG